MQRFGGQLVEPTGGDMPLQLAVPRRSIVPREPLPEPGQFSPRKPPDGPEISATVVIGQRPRSLAAAQFKVRSNVAFESP